MKHFVIGVIVTLLVGGCIFGLYKFQEPPTNETKQEQVVPEPDTVEQYAEPTDKGDTDTTGVPSDNGKGGYSSDQDTKQDTDMSEQEIEARGLMPNEPSQPSQAKDMSPKESKEQTVPASQYNQVVEQILAIDPDTDITPMNEPVPVSSYNNAKDYLNDLQLQSE